MCVFKIQQIKIITLAFQFLLILFVSKTTQATTLPSEDSSKASSSSGGCGLYSDTDFLGDVILTLKSFDIVYDTNLIRDSLSIAKSIRLHPNCGLFLCSLPKFKGDCYEHFTSYSNVTQPFEFQSAMCQCSPKSNTASRNPNSCAVLYQDWNFSGKSQKVLFPGSGGGINAQADLKSVKIKPNCSITLWKHLPEENKQVSLDLEISTSYLKPATDGNYEWYCCHCDASSAEVCKNAKETQNIYQAEGEGGQPDRQEFSQFVKYGKKIIGIGRNYRWKKSELAKVLKEPQEPIVFMKPSTSYITEGHKIELLESLGTIFYEIELGVVIGKKGRSIAKAQALDHVAGYFLALDMTAKGFLKKSINQSLPWEIGKGFDTACPVGHFIPKEMIPNPNDIHLECKVNGNVTQSENTSGMIFDVPHLISYISKFMTLEPYDVILTGTPDGLGPLSPGDLIEGQLGNLTTIRFEAVAVMDKSD